MPNTAIPASASWAEVVAAFAAHGHSRLPVHGDTLDEIKGMMLMKDVFAILASNKPAPKDWASLMRQPLFVPQARHALDVLGDMRASRVHLAVVVDEYSGTDGIITFEDLVEEIVGEIEDEHDDAPTELLRPLGEGMWDADARAKLDDVAAKIEAYKALAKKLQNRDGTLSTSYFKGPGQEADTRARISTSGHIIEWLSLAMTDEELRAPWMQNAVNALIVLILDLNDGPADGGSLYHAAHGLHLYHERVFGAPAAYLPLVKGDPPLPHEDLAALRPRLEGALDKIRGNELTTKHGFWTVFHGILGMGLEKTMLTVAKER